MSTSTNVSRGAVQSLQSVKRESVGTIRLLLFTKGCLFQWIFALAGRLCSGGCYVLTEQMRLLLLVSGWEVVISIMIFSGYCFWSVWFALWCKSIFFDLFWNVNFFTAAKLKGFRLFKVPPGSQWKAIFSVSLVCRSKFRRMDCSLNWSFINYGELCWDSFMICSSLWVFSNLDTAEISSFCRSLWGRIPDCKNIFSTRATFTRQLFCSFLNVLMCGKFHK